MSIKHASSMKHQAASATKFFQPFSETSQGQKQGRFSSMHDRRRASCIMKQQPLKLWTPALSSRADGCSFCEKLWRMQREALRYLSLLPELCSSQGDPGSECAG